MLNIDYQIEILQAYKEGKTIIGYCYIPGPCNPPEEGDFCFNIKTHPDAAFNFQEKYYSIKPEQKTRRMTNRELAKWCAEGKGQYISMGYHPGSVAIYPGYAYTHFDYCIDEDDFDEGEVDDAILIRGWDEEEWHKPLVEMSYDKVNL